LDAFSGFVRAAMTRFALSIALTVTVTFAAGFAAD
jgi:hypothetical protein